MSRIAKNPISIPSGVLVTQEDSVLTAKGSLGSHSVRIVPEVQVSIDSSLNKLAFSWDYQDTRSSALAGTMSVLVANLLIGVSKGFEKRLQLVGVGYRAQAAGSDLNLTLGFSHPVVHKIPSSLKVETPSQTEIVIKGVDKQLVGQVAADIRSYRPPEPYKGKGVRYLGEKIVIKETKKK
jgi:large subunit ribosomal protein L6